MKEMSCRFENYDKRILVCMAAIFMALSPKLSCKCTLCLHDTGRIGTVLKIVRFCLFTWNRTLSNPLFLKCLHGTGRILDREFLL